VISRPIQRRFSANLANAFGDHLDEVRTAMEELAGRFEPVELNRIGFRLYERFRPEIPLGHPGWGREGGAGCRQDPGYLSARAVSISEASGTGE
jgi:hypothetical protein